jgi:hypothetical protein
MGVGAVIGVPGTIGVDSRWPDEQVRRLLASRKYDPEEPNECARPNRPGRKRRPEHRKEST